MCDVNGWSFVKNSRKYYDDCAQILSEHILATMKPHVLRVISTLDPLLTTSLNRLDDEITEGGDTASAAAPPPGAKMNKFLSRAARLLQGESGAEEESEEEDNRTANTMGDVDAMSQHSHPEPYPGTLSPVRSVGDGPVAKATTLVEGALRVREFPNTLTSEPASLVQSSNSSAVEELDPPRRTRSSSIQQSHQEELRCVIAIIRHGDRYVALLTFQ